MEDSSAGLKRRLSDADMPSAKKKKLGKKKKAIDPATTAAMPGGGGIGSTKAERDAELEDRQRLTALLATFSTDQMERYEAFRRSHFDKNKVKKVIQRVAGVDSVSNEMAVALGGVAKIFAGELIELAREDMSDFKGPIHPMHIRNAYRKLRQAGKIPYLPTPPRGLID